MRRCKMCRAKVTSGGILTPEDKSKVALCSWECFTEYQKSPAAKKMFERMRRADLTERKERLKTMEDHIKTAQRHFNAYIRARDKNKTCVSCNRPLTLKNPKTSKHYGFDCGHYISRSLSGKGSSKYRFNPKCCAGQCKRCNKHSAGNFVEMRKGMIERFGIEHIESIENNNEERKFTISELERISTVFANRAKLYNKIFRASKASKENNDSV